MAQFLLIVRGICESEITLQLFCRVVCYFLFYIIWNLFRHSLLGFCLAEKLLLYVCVEIPIRSKALGVFNVGMQLNAL